MRRFYIIGVVILAFILRFWNLDSFPALNADEASLGYDAYSLIQTGKDQHGNPWPIHFQSFNDYKPGLYVYLIYPFIRFLGLNEWTVRIPGAALGVLSVYIIYLLSKELFKDKGQKVGLISSLFLAISPWHIHFSRGGWEVNVATFLIISGTWLFLLFIKKNNFKNLVLSFLAFVLSMYAYHSARIITPALGFGFLIIYRKVLTANIKKTFISVLPAVLLLIPLMVEIFSPAGFSRAAGVGLFADPGPISRVEEQRSEHNNILSIETKVIHNKIVNYSLAFLQNWTDHFHGEFLFLSGDDIQRNKVPETGQLYLMQLPFLIIGMYYFLIKFSDEKKVVIWWLIVSPVAAALTFQSPHALRSHNMVIPLTILSAYGFVKLTDVIRTKINKKHIVKLLFGVMYLLIFWEFSRYEHMYWIHMAKEYPFSSQYGVKEMAEYIKNNYNDFDKFIITDRYDQPYILTLFYLKYNPHLFQNNHELLGKDKFGFSTVPSFDKFEFRSIDVKKEYAKDRPIVIIGTPEEMSINARYKKVYGQNGFNYFSILEKR